MISQKKASLRRRLGWSVDVNRSGKLPDGAASLFAITRAVGCCATDEVKNLPGAGRATKELPAGCTARVSRWKRQE